MFFLKTGWIPAMLCKILVLYRQSFNATGSFVWFPVILWEFLEDKPSHSTWRCGYLLPADYRVWTRNDHPLDMGCLILMVVMPILQWFLTNSSLQQLGFISYFLNMACRDVWNTLFLSFQPHQPGSQTPDGHEFHTSWQGMTKSQHSTPIMKMCWCGDELNAYRITISQKARETCVFDVLYRCSSSAFT